MRHKQFTILLGLALGLGMSPSGRANVLTSATATANCQGYTLTLNAADLSPGTTYTINYIFWIACGGASPTTASPSVTGSITFTATAITATEVVTGTFGSSGGMSGCAVIGQATLTPDGSSAFIDINGQGFITGESSAPATLTCPMLTLACAAGSGQVGTPYSSSLVATGGVPPYTFSITSGSLPPPLVLNGTTGAITGTPSSSGTFNFTAQVVDSSGNPAINTVTSTCGITIATGPPPPTCSTGTQPITYNLHESGQNASEIVWFN